MGNKKNKARKPGFPATSSPATREIVSVTVYPQPEYSQPEYPQPEYPQPEESRYATTPYRITIGHEYCVLEHYLRPYPELLRHCHPYHSDYAYGNTLRDVNEDIGHTLIHFLYTGKYETMEPQILHISPRALEFERSAHVYHAARQYEISGLEVLAKEYMQRFNDAVTITQILDIARKVYSRLPSDEEWFHWYIRSKLFTAFMADEEQLKRDVKESGIGTEIHFDRFVFETMLDMYSTNLASWRYRALKGDGVNGHGDVPSSDEAPEPADAQETVEEFPGEPVDDPYDDAFPDEPPPPAEPLVEEPPPADPVPLEDPYDAPAVQELEPAPPTPEFEPESDPVPEEPPSVFRWG
ncbi:hypothetical protein BO71DRAFT_390574 [Aspergillus ellipticus CBS 707.79]|uniref:BTB domain-containing protein n=1 Tax=Aspergillus ellipticus CBS 707.79 TaxID=1448320 RepID=A0A319CUY0_9EURO|nr:hypothetical protein BO71DRAFT_390574 [Aspergillus ellipticus CBS 707.79]